MVEVTFDPESGAVSATSEMTAAEYLKYIDDKADAAEAECPQGTVMVMMTTLKGRQFIAVPQEYLAKLQDFYFNSLRTNSDSKT